MTRLQHSLTFIRQIVLSYLRHGLTLVLIGTAFASFMIFLVGLLFMTISPEYGLTPISMLRMVVEASSFVALGLSFLLGIGLVWNTVGAILTALSDTTEFDWHILREAMTLRLLAFNMIGIPLALITLIILSGANLFGVMCMGSLSVMFGLIAGNTASNAWEDVVKRYIDREEKRQREEEIRQYVKRKTASKAQPDDLKATANLIDDSEDHAPDLEAQQTQQFSKRQSLS